MQFTEKRYKVVRIRKEAEIQENGKTIYLKEIYNEAGKDIICAAFLYDGRKEITKRYYGVVNRQIVIDELTNIANGRIPCGYSAIKPFEPEYLK